MQSDSSATRATLAALYRRRSRMASCARDEGAASANIDVIARAPGLWSILGLEEENDTDELEHSGDTEEGYAMLRHPGPSTGEAIIILERLFSVPCIASRRRHADDPPETNCAFCYAGPISGDEDVDGAKKDLYLMARCGHRVCDACAPRAYLNLNQAVHAITHQLLQGKTEADLDFSPCCAAKHKIHELPPKMQEPVRAILAGLGAFREEVCGATGSLSENPLDSKRCPMCRFPIAKIANSHAIAGLSGGTTACHHVQCLMCAADLCYVCMEELKTCRARIASCPTRDVAVMILSASSAGCPQLPAPVPPVQPAPGCTIPTFDTAAHDGPCDDTAGAHPGADADLNTCATPLCEYIALLDMQLGTGQRVTAVHVRDLARPHLHPRVCNASTPFEPAPSGEDEGDESGRGVQQQAVMEQAQHTPIAPAEVFVSKGIVRRVVWRGCEIPFQQVLPACDNFIYCNDSEGPLHSTLGDTLQQRPYYTESRTLALAVQTVRITTHGGVAIEVATEGPAKALEGFGSVCLMEEVD